MKKLIGPLLIGLLGLSITAQAAIVEVSYEGTIYGSYGDGAGYAKGDTISGSLFINTDLAPVDSDAHSSIGYYNNNYSDNSDFVTGYAENDARSQDRIHIRDETYNSLDQFFIQDYEWSFSSNLNGNGHYSQKYLSINAYDYVIDFIQGDGLEQNFELFATDGLQGFNGTVFDYSYYNEDYQQVIQNNGYAYFNLNRLAVSSTSVPEPASILLLSAGLAGLGFTRKLKKT